MAARGSALTLTGHAYDKLRSDILLQRLEPGQPLRIAALARELGVSMSVVREALTRLSAQGLVATSPNQGFRVVALAESDLTDLTQLRVTLECIALERSISQGDIEWEGRVISTHHVLERTALPGGTESAQRDQWIVAHAAFHDALSSACGSPRLLDLVRTLRDSAEVYRQWSGPTSHERGRDIAREHRTLMELATAGRVDEASAALKYHIETTTRLVLDGRAKPETARPEPA